MPRQNAHTKRTAAAPAEQRGRPTKVPARQQVSVHLRADQKAFCERYAEMRSAQEGVGVSLSDVVRLAVDDFMSAHREEVMAGNASNT